MQVLWTRHLRCPRVLLVLLAVYSAYAEIAEVLGIQTAGVKSAAGSIWGLALDADKVGDLVPYNRVVSTS